MPDMERAVIQGYVDRVIFENPENGYAVLAVSNDKIEVTVTGRFQGIGAGTLRLMTAKASSVIWVRERSREWGKSWRQGS